MNWWLGLLAVGSLAGLQSAAQAQECTDDFDCGAGQKCGWNGGTVDPGDPSTDVGGSGAGAAEDIAAPCDPDSSGGCGGDSLPPPDARTCVSLDRGECETTADCMPGLECQKYSYGACDGGPAKPTEPGGVDLGGDEDVADPVPEPLPCDAEPVEAKVGYCVLPTTVCTSDDDCLLGLTCVAPNGSGSSGSSGGSTGSGGGVDPSEPAPDGDSDIIAEPVPPVDDSDDKPAEPPVETPSVCVYVPQDCANNAPCDAGFTCTKVATVSWCDAGPACPPGETCDPAPTPPECGSDYEYQCIPAQDPCTTDADCEDNWVCSDFGGEDGLEAPESWATEGKAVKSCLPVGIALAANSSNGGGGGSIAYPQEDGAGKGDGADLPTDAHDDGMDTGANAKDGSGSSCSVGFSGGSLNGAWLALGLVGLVSRRRRRAA
jgi:MYXO-CTERM domain-containing protein